MERGGRRAGEAGDSALDGKIPLCRARVPAAMQRSGLGAIALWVFTAGIFAWIFPNLSLGSPANAATDAAIVLGGILAAVGLPRAVEGIGTGARRLGRSIAAVFHPSQNIVPATTT